MCPHAMAEIGTVLLDSQVFKHVHSSQLVHVPVGVIFMKCRLSQSVVRCLWHPKLNQIVVGCADGKTKVFFSPKHSFRYVLHPTNFYSYTKVYVNAGSVHVVSFPKSHSQSLIPKVSFPKSHSQSLISKVSFPKSHSQSLIPTVSFPKSHSQNLIPKVSFPKSHSHGLIMRFNQNM